MNKILFSLLFAGLLTFLPGLIPAQTQLELVGVAQLPKQFLPGVDTVGTSDVWGWTGPDGTEYAIVGTLTGIHFVRASDQQILDVEPGPSQNDAYYHRDIKTYGNYAYTCAEMNGNREGISIFDLSYLPDSVHFVKAFNYGPNRHRSHNISIDVAMAKLYIIDQNYTGTYIMSLADPENPVDIGFIPTPDNHDIVARNDTVWVAEGYQYQYSVWFASNPQAPVKFVQITDPNFGYAHNIWPFEDGRYFLTTEETDFKTVKIWDMATPISVSMVGQYLGTSNLAHNVQVKGDSVYISHYESGITVVDISDPSQPVEVGYYDTYPASDLEEFHGCWGAFPYSQNGYIYASSLEGYLHVLKFANPLGLSKPVPHVRLVEAFPNPVVATTQIAFQLNKPGPVKIEIFNLSGQKVITLLNENRKGGANFVEWNASNDNGTRVASGTYIYTVSTADQSVSGKLVVE